MSVVGIKSQGLVKSSQCIFIALESNENVTIVDVSFDVVGIKPQHLVEGNQCILVVLLFLKLEPFLIPLLYLPFGQDFFNCKTNALRNIEECFVLCVPYRTCNRYCISR